MKKYTFLHALVLWFVKITGVLPCLLFYKPKVYLMNEKCSRRLPKPSILMSNHKSLMDFPLYLLIFPLRTLRFQMAEVLYNKGKLFAWFLHALGGIRVNRDTKDMAFIGNTLEVLDHGGIVGIFPESRLPVNGVPWPFKPSIAYIALHTDAPIIPIYTDGCYGIKKRAHVMIGEAIHVHEFMNEAAPNQETYHRITAILEDHENKLKAELERRLNKNG